MSIRNIRVLAGLAGLAYLSFGAQVHAASTADLTVVGSVVPIACAVTLGGNGIVDYSTLAKSTVQAYVAVGTTAYTLPPKNVPLTVTCDSALPIALQWTDNRPGTKPAIDARDSFYFGLGLTAANAQIGAYSIGYTALRVNFNSSATAVQPGANLVRPINALTPWTQANLVGENTLFTPAKQLTFAATSLLSVPTPLSAISGSIAIQPYLSKTLIDAMTTEIKLDGAATLTLIYL